MKIKKEQVIKIMQYLKSFVKTLIKIAKITKLIVWMNLILNLLRIII
jgi:hypothetical protein